MELVRAVRHALNEDPDLDSEALFAREDIFASTSWRSQSAGVPNGRPRRRPSVVVSMTARSAMRASWMAELQVSKTLVTAISNVVYKADGCCRSTLSRSPQGLCGAGGLQRISENPVKVEGNGNEKEMYWYKDEDGESQVSEAEDQGR